MTYDDLRNLDPKDMPNWPLPAQIGALAIIALIVLFLGYYLVLSDQLDRLKEGQTQEETLKQTFVDKKRQAINQSALEAQLKEIQQSFGALIKQLPTKSEMESLLTEINQAGIGRGLQFELFRPGTEVKSPEMAEVPIDIRLSGTYNELAAFASDVGQLSRIVTIGNVVLTPIAGKDQRLAMQAVAKTYRALEPQEIAAQTPPPQK
ncbi:type 4a pilus biogenesis protein PilO [Crenobacter cavernae]|uniref:Pilus assembly protein PilO n=1 Tax=Crenobacter cavernae TaxID=2290923 RepID=A0A345Y5T0_9NEIS|nr:type 4a pilus biogenesis protein PilO [Crenobacter cavernae]AXK39282.1 pilus assembly protein PilO [Crenobacter cavernae]